MRLIKGNIGERVFGSFAAVWPMSQKPEQPYILIMHDVGPSDVARLNKDRVAGILTAVGGASAHSAYCGTCSSYSSSRQVRV